MRTIGKGVALAMVLLLVGCTKKLKEDITNLQVELESLKTSKAELDVIIANLQRSNADFEALYESDFIGCWYTTTSAIRGASTEIQIYPGGVGSLDFGGGVYQVFSWSQRNDETILHFGDVLYCSCFGVDYNFIMDSAQILFGEMFDQDHRPTIELTENETEFFNLTDWAGNDIIFDRCIIN